MLLTLKPVYPASAMTAGANDCFAITPPPLAKQCNKIQLFCCAPRTFFRLLFTDGARTRLSIARPHLRLIRHRAPCLCKELMRFAEDTKGRPAAGWPASNRWRICSKRESVCLSMQRLLAGGGGGGQYCIAVTFALHFLCILLTYGALLALPFAAGIFLPRPHSNGKNYNNSE